MSSGPSNGFADNDERPGSPESAADRGVGRRALLVGGLTLGALAIGGLGVTSEVIPVPERLSRKFRDRGVDGTIPDAAPGATTLVQRTSPARNQPVGFFTAVPAGYGDGAGLPVCLVLHGASATTADYQRFGLGQFLTAAVQAGTPPFVLAGADGGRTFWAGNGTTDDPQRMLREEIPAWCDQQGFDTSRMAGYGWSMGGHGVLLASEQSPGWLMGVAALSPAVFPGDAVFAGAGAIDGARTGLWCGTADALYPSVLELAATIRGGPAIAAYAPGAHTRGYWNRITPDAFAFIGRALTPA